MKSKAATVAQYLASLPSDRRAVVSTVRRFIRKHLDPALRECMQYGVIGYCVPHSVWPRGHHTNPALPLMYMGLSSQKNDMVVYMLFLQHNRAERAWLADAWNAAGMTARLEVGGMGCCLRFKKVEDLALDVIGRAMLRVPVTAYLDNHAAMLERIGRAAGVAAKAGRGENTPAGAARRTRSTTVTAATRKRASRRAGRPQRGL
ncbi:MAG: DUF1801 domain-containing protein [Phycisphaeraceae bacterium]|nr:DUF1801 domain-containing protein [Phycisphaeraceae bacterium]